MSVHSLHKFVLGSAPIANRKSNAGGLYNRTAQESGVLLDGYPTLKYVLGDAPYSTSNSINREPRSSRAEHTAWSDCCSPRMASGLAP